MAGARDVKRETARIRREQAEKNRKAREAQEARLTKMEERSGLSPGELRRLNNIRRQNRATSNMVERRGHRVRPDAQFSLKASDFDYPNKMDSGVKISTKKSDKVLEQSVEDILEKLEGEKKADKILGILQSEAKGKNRVTLIIPLVEKAMQLGSDRKTVLKLLFDSGVSKKVYIRSVEIIDTYEQENSDAG